MDLNTLIPPNSSIYLNGVCDINNKGEILCTGYNSAYPVYLLLTPTPAITIRDAKNDTIPNVSFDLIKITGDLPLFTETELGSFTTDGEGRLELTPISEDTFSVDLSTGTKRLVVGDSLKISKRVKSVPAVKHAGVLGTMYSITVDNAKFDAASEISFDTLVSSGRMDVVLDHTEICCNLLVSVEWDAAVSYLSSLQEGFRGMSNYLYDVSDGQMRLDTVMICDDKAHWDDADMRINASNMVRPHVAALNGITRAGAAGDPVEMPRKWFLSKDLTRNGTYAENPLNLAHPHDFRTKCHELGHYAFNFGDEYMFADGSGGYVAEAGRCGSIANYGFMDTQWNYPDPYSSEMSSIYRYQDGACRNTHQFVINNGSCWDYFEEGFERKWSADSIYAAIITPDDGERKLQAGFEYLSGPNDEMILDCDVGALVKFPLPALPPDPDIATFEVQVETATNRIAKADVTLFNGYFNLNPTVIYQGQTDDGAGRIRVVGVTNSDWLLQASTGRAIVLPLPLGLAASPGEKVWMCGEASVGGPGEKRVENQSRANGDTVTIQLRAVAGDYPLICAANLGDDDASYRLDIVTAFASPPTLDMLPGAGGYHAYNFTYDGTRYSAQASDAMGEAGIFTIWAKDALSQNFFITTAYAVTQFEAGAASWNATGPQGAAEALIDTSNAALLKGMIVSSPYPPIRTGLDQVNIQAGEIHSLSVYPPGSLAGHNRIVLRYADSDMDVGGGVRGTETSLQVFYWNEGSQQWNQAGGTVDTIQNVVSAVITDAGVYAAFTTEIETGIDDGGEDDERGDLPSYRFNLSQNYPNPFNPVTTIEYSVPSRAHVRIEIFDVLGRKVRTLVNETKQAGSYRAEWNGTDDAGRPVSTGVYLYRYKADKVTQTKKMLLLK